MHRARLSLLACMLLISLVLVGLEAHAVFQQDPDAGGGSCTSYKCDWCCQAFCGCSNPGDGWHFTGWCTCSSLECNRTCDWSPSSG